MRFGQEREPCRMMKSCRTKVLRRTRMLRRMVMRCLRWATWSGPLHQAVRWSTDRMPWSHRPCSDQR